MSLFAIADLHLPLGQYKPMDEFEGWENYVSKIKNNWRRLVTDGDTVVIAGDISWAMRLEEAKKDFEFLQKLPGRKLLIKGNHDYWWATRRKMEKFFEDCGFDTLSIIHNSAEAVGDFVVCGTRGWFFDADEDADKKVLLREVGRLERSIQEALKTGKEPVVFLHYPPVLGESRCEELLAVLSRYKIRRCYCGHIHGAVARKIPVQTVNGTVIRLVSCDAVNFTPVLVR
ncbi:MAG TPA: metallophosphoesterase [Candidatus Avimonas sp.]|jgi:predicted phosphohydrolase|nr:serine/threonine protein phosphatase [Clostridiales bacterium]HOB35964.1 metallophosphoesterase [Candidatus Avimonas sp.]HQA15865.1 metallophosphoesterase [Candidatus Avimonas sp.]HQD37400.1 metallophosphoesterase [Candidatus Avimonas sp.]